MNRAEVLAILRPWHERTVDLQRQHREDVIHAASIRAMLCAARGLSESQACHPHGCPQHVDATLAAHDERGECDDTEGGCCD